MDGKVHIGIDVGGTKLAYGLFDKEHHCLAKLKAPSMPEAEADVMIGAMVSHMDKLLAQAGYTRDDLGGVGAAFPSHIDTRIGVIITTSNLPHWNHIPIQRILSERMGCRVVVDNDANVVAIAEHRIGAGRGHKHMMFVTISTGIGCGIIINDQIFHGSIGMAGEIGHMFISDTYGFKCGCGSVGCVESIVSGPKVELYMKKRLQEGAKSCLSEIDGHVTTHHLADAVRINDPLAMETIELMSEYLARMFASLYQALNIDHVVYGGGLTKIPLLIDKMTARFDELVLHAKDYPVTFVPVALGDDMGIIGASFLVTD